MTSTAVVFTRSVNITNNFEQTAFVTGATTNVSYCNTWHMRWIRNSGRSRISKTDGANIKRGGRQPIIVANFPRKIHEKMKKIGQNGYPLIVQQSFEVVF